MRFLNERLSLTAEYFNKETNDLIVDIKATPEVGFGSATVNAGSVVNKGFEFEASGKIKSAILAIQSVATSLHYITKLPISIQQLLV